MSKKDIYKIASLYNKSVGDSLEDIKNILNESNSEAKLFLPQYKDVLTKTANNIANKWKIGEKYLRTSFALEAFGKYYPVRHLGLSITIDAMINILDDLFDKDLSRNDKAEYILEFLRTFSLYSFDKYNFEFQSGVGHYFNKLITLALGEQWLLAESKKKNRLADIIKISSDLLYLRSHDMDIFIEIALANYKQKENISAIHETGRIFRALNILKKDIIDAERDKEENQETLITFMINNKDHDFMIYIDNLVGVYMDKVDKVKAASKFNTKKVRYPLFKLLDMIKRENHEIKQLLLN